MNIAKALLAIVSKRKLPGSDWCKFSFEFLPKSICLNRKIRIPDYNRYSITPN